MGFPGGSSDKVPDCQSRKVKSESEVAQSCPTLSDPMDCSPPGPSVPGIPWAGALAWVPSPSPMQESEKRK